MLNRQRFVLFFIAISVIVFSYAFTGPINTNPDSPAFIDDYLGQLNFVEDRLLQLEDAFPQEKMDWRPADGIRSVAEIFLHITEANYYLVSNLNGKAAELDMQTSDKEKIAEMLKTSFTKIKENVAGLTAEDLDKTTKAFGMDMSTRNFMISILNHMHEHMGQAIAYARMNGVVPPWSKKQEGKK